MSDIIECLVPSPLQFDIANRRVAGEVLDLHPDLRQQVDVDVQVDHGQVFDIVLSAEDKGQLVADAVAVLESSFSLRGLLPIRKLLARQRGFRISGEMPVESMFEFVRDFEDVVAAEIKNEY